MSVLPTDLQRHRGKHYQLLQNVHKCEFIRICKICLNFREIKVPTKWLVLLSDHVHIRRKEYLRWEERGQGQGEPKGALPSQQSKASYLGAFPSYLERRWVWGAETDHLYTDHTSRQHEWRHVSCHLVNSNWVVDIQIHFFEKFYTFIYFWNVITVFL